MKITPAEIAKALTCLVLCLSGAVAQGLINGAAAAWVTIAIGALATAGVFAVPNKPPSS